MSGGPCCQRPVGHSGARPTLLSGTPVPDLPTPRTRCEAFRIVTTMVAVVSVLCPLSSNGLELRFLEHAWFQPVALQQLVEFGAIALGKRGGLGDVAARNLEQTDKIVAFELLTRLLEWR